MEAFLNTHQGVPALLASICVIMTLSLLVKIGEFLWAMVSKRGDLTQQSIKDLTSAVQVNTQAVTDLNLKISTIEKDMAQIPGFKDEIRRMFIAIRFLAGDRWGEVKSVMEDIP